VQRLHNEVYDSSQRKPLIIEEALALYKYQGLIAQFVSRTLKIRYKRSVLGVVWTMLNPLLTMIVLTLVFSNLFRFSIPFYPVYLLSGLIMWACFSSTTQTAMGEMINGGNLFSRIYVPKSIFAVSALGASLINLGIAIIPLLLIALVLGVKVQPTIVVWPLAILLLSLFTLGVGLIMATAAAYFADILPVYDVLLVVWMYMTPIFYPIEIISPSIVWIFKFNPMYYFLMLFREPLYLGQIPELQYWLIAFAIAITTFIGGSLLFTSKSNEYAYRV
jgi:ABC-type polysaccharide/polyol phosphate export permease